MKYRRARESGGTYFLTLVTHERKPFLCQPHVFAALRDAVEHVKERHAFQTIAYVILPDHRHLLWRLPGGDADFSMRVRLIKHFMARRLPEPRPIWQKRFWERLIRDDADLNAHLDYIHFNPVKHGVAESPISWPHSSFRRFVEKEYYPADWGSGIVLVEGEYGE